MHEREKQIGVPQGIMLDSNVHDLVAKDATLKALIEQCQRDGRIRVLSTHIQADQLAAIPAERDIGQAVAVRSDHIPTSAAAWDVSRWDEAHWGSDAANNAFNKLAIGNPKHAADALIGVTALSEADILVTNEKKGFRNRFARLGSNVRVMSTMEFHAFLKTL
jgi:hypothetical protein